MGDFGKSSEGISLDAEVLRASETTCWTDVWMFCLAGVGLRDGRFWTHTEGPHGLGTGYLVWPNWKAACILLRRHDYQVVGFPRLWMHQNHAWWEDTALCLFFLTLYFIRLERISWIGKVGLFVALFFCLNWIVLIICSDWPQWNRDKPWNMNFTSPLYLTRFPSSFVGINEIKSSECNGSLEGSRKEICLIIAKMETLKPQTDVHFSSCTLMIDARLVGNLCTTHQWHFTLIFNYKSSKENLHKVELILSYFVVFFIFYKFP